MFVICISAFLRYFNLYTSYEYLCIVLQFSNGLKCSYKGIHYKLGTLQTVESFGGSEVGINCPCLILKVARWVGTRSFLFSHYIMFY